MKKIILFSALLALAGCIPKDIQDEQEASYRAHLNDQDSGYVFDAKYTIKPSRNSPIHIVEFTPDANPYITCIIVRGYDNVTCYPKGG